MSRRHGRGERKDLETAERQVRKAVSGQAEIARQGDRLGGLERQRIDAEAAQRRLAHFEKALEVRDWRAELARVEAELAALPEVLDRLNGPEMDQLEQREMELEEKRDQTQSRLMALKMQVSSQHR